MQHTMMVTPERRRYNRWVADETLEDFALRFTARRARKWSYLRVANTAIGSISFLALEAIGGTVTITYGFDIAVAAIMFVGLIIFLTSLPISYYAAKYGVDIDLLTRGAGFGYIGSTITSLIYASFTFIFFALEAAILSFAMEFCFGIPLSIGYLISALVVIPIVINGFSKISAIQTWTQPIWILLHLLPFVLLGFVGYDIDNWTQFKGQHVPETGYASLLMFGAASGVVFSLIAQIGEQVDFLRFLPEPKTKKEKSRWWAALLAAGPGWSVLGVIKLLAGSYLVTLAIRESVLPSEATDPTRMYFVAFNQVIPWDVAVLTLTGIFVILSQVKINLTNAYAGSIAWSNFFSRLTHAHPGRVVWLVFNVAIALMLMELGVFHALEKILGLYSHVALAWIGALVADLVINKPLGLSPAGIEFRRAHLYDINPVGIGAMVLACIVSFLAVTGVLGATAHALSSFLALAVAFVAAPVIAWATGGRYYLARTDHSPKTGEHTCSVCEYSFDAEDIAHCPFHSGPICSLCCTLDAACRDHCKPKARIGAVFADLLKSWLPNQHVETLFSRQARFVAFTLLFAALFGGLLLEIRSYQDSQSFDTVLLVIFTIMLIVIGIAVWLGILGRESRDKAQQEVEAQTERLLREVRAHQRTDMALQKAKEKAEAANTAKTRYMTGLSHELRTPLNAIYGFAQLLEKAPDLPENRRNSVSTIRRSSEHLAGLIEGLLDISRIEAGRLEIARDRINLAVFLQQIASIFEEQAAEKNIRFSVQTEGKLPEWVFGDEKRLRQVLINLLSNAFRYTETGEVNLRLRYRNEVAVIEVEDTGIGIAPDDMERIWNPFERGENQLVKGTGLGLTITRLLVETQGGDIDVESIVGKGSTFTVRMMLASVPSDKLLAEPQAGRPQGKATTGYLGPRKTILIVDDDPNHLAIVENFLSPIGFRILKAPNAEVAQHMLQDLTPDAFILDIDMPGLDGWEFAAQLREAAYRTTPIIMISGHAEDENKPTLETSLSDAFLAKPYNLDDLLSRLCELLRVETVKGDGAKAEEDHGAKAQLSDADASELIALASLGHAKALSDKIAEIEHAADCAPELIENIKAHATRFEHAKLIELLKAQTVDAV